MIFFGEGLKYRSDLSSAGHEFTISQHRIRVGKLWPSHLTNMKSEKETLSLMV